MSASLRWTFVGLAGAAAVVAGFVAVAETAPKTSAGLAVAQALPIATPDLDFARGVIGDASKVQDLPLAAARTDAALALAPRRLLATLVEMDVHVAQSRGRLDDRARGLLGRTYDMSPLDYTYGVNRLTFAFDHWSELTPELRMKALRELKCLAGVQGQVEHLPERIANSSGAFSATLSLRMAERSGSLCHTPYQKP